VNPVRRQRRRGEERRGDERRGEERRGEEERRRGGIFSVGRDVQQSSSPAA